MARWSGSVEVDAVDLALVRSAISSMFDQLRNLSFSEGFAIDPVSGQQLTGLRDVTGTHPAVGTTYVADPMPADISELIASLPPEHAARYASSTSARSSTVTIIADDAHRLAVAFVGTTGDGAGYHTEIEALRPMRSEEFIVKTAVETDAPWPMRGVLTADVHATLEDFGRGHRGGPTAHATLTHRRARGDADLSVAGPAHRSVWNVRVTVCVNGRGLLRPFAAVGWWIVRKRIDVRLARPLDGLARLAREINIECEANPSPEQLAIGDRPAHPSSGPIG